MGRNLLNDINHSVLNPLRSCASNKSYYFEFKTEWVKREEAFLWINYTIVLLKSQITTGNSRSSRQGCYSAKFCEKPNSAGRSWISAGVICQISKIFSCQMSLSTGRHWLLTDENFFFWKIFTCRQAFSAGRFHISAGRNVAGRNVAGGRWHVACGRWQVACGRWHVADGRFCQNFCRQAAAFKNI